MASEKKNKGPLVKILDSDVFQKIGRPCSETDAARFLYDEGKRVQLLMINSPEVMDPPKPNRPGSIRLNNHKTVPLNPDNTFYYGAWPQETPSNTVLERLDNKEASQTVNSYKIKGDIHYEYELDDDRYVKIKGTDNWFKVQFIKWIYDPKLKKAYTEKALWNLDEADECSLDYFWRHGIFLSTKQLKKAEQKSSLLDRLENGMQTLQNAHPIPQATLDI